MSSLAEEIYSANHANQPKSEGRSPAGDIVVSTKKQSFFAKKMTVTPPQHHQKATIEATPKEKGFTSFIRKGSMNKEAKKKKTKTEEATPTAVPAPAASSPPTINHMKKERRIAAPSPPAVVTPTSHEARGQPSPAASLDLAVYESEAVSPIRQHKTPAKPSKELQGIAHLVGEGETSRRVEDSFDVMEYVHQTGTATETDSVTGSIGSLIQHCQGGPSLHPPPPKESGSSYSFDLTQYNTIGSADPLAARPGSPKNGYKMDPSVAELIKSFNLNNDNNSVKSKETSDSDSKKPLVNGNVVIGGGGILRTVSSFKKDGTAPAVTPVSREGSMRRQRVVSFSGRTAAV
ncbi:hypothetical protein ADEAN_000109300 [Angomonas deanei]|uniref:Uncharacterized protein n=1 Tax=Angomonas deanei TaxID=59799 RepID=A0A7G2C1Q1_9TRYP|nr:hypothetical protein ADEAN_000109300 [Angomonas deanei]